MNYRAKLNLKPNAQTSNNEARGSCGETGDRGLDLTPVKYALAVLLVIMIR